MNRAQPRPALRLVNGGDGASGDGGGAAADTPLTWEQVYRAHAADVVRWAARLLGPHGEPDDVAHEVFLVVRRRLAEFRGEARISTWLHEITVRVAQQHRRSDRRWRWLQSKSEATEARRQAWMATLDPNPGDHLNPLAQLERLQDTAALYALLDGLEEKYRTALILHRLENLPVTEIAAITGATVGNVWSRLNRGREKFHQRYVRWKRRQSI